MGKRSELRRQQKSNVGNKGKQMQDKKFPTNVIYGSEKQVQNDFGISLQQLKAYLSRMEKEIKDDCVKEYQEKISKSEEYIAVGNLLIAIYAIKMSRKNREHTKDLIHRMLDNYNTAMHYVNKVGIKEAYKQAHEELDVTLEFDSDNLNEEFGFGGDGE